MKYWRALRRRVLTPNVSATRLDVRGFHEKNPEAKAVLERVGLTFLTGYGEAAQARRPTDVDGQLATIETRFRGFAYEGAAMAFAIRDALPVGGGRLVRDFLDGSGQDHIYMAYVGIGWAMARLPRWRWSKLYAPDDLLRWLVLDGYGFHQAYFRTAQYVHQQFQEEDFGWPAEGPSAYASRVIDQGIGRAMWFVAGTDAALLTTMFDEFPPHRRADLYSGAGLAATYAGGADEAELRTFWQDAGPYRADLAQGAAFAAGARVRARLLVPHNDLATQVFCGMTAVEAAAVTDETLPDGPDGPDVPAYEVWRRRIAGEFVALGRC